MKIAVCFYGKLRTANFAYNNFINYIGDLLPDCDFFIHTWDDTNNHRMRHNMAPVSDHLSQEDINQYIYNYSPKKHKVENQSKFREYLDNNYGSSGELVYQYYSYYQSNLLKREYEKVNNFEYDIVLKMRPDIIFDPDRRFIDDIKDYLKNPNEILIDWLTEALQISNSAQADISADFYETHKFTNFFGIHKLAFNDYYKWVSVTNNIPIRYSKDQRLTIFRNTETSLDPILNFNQIRYLTSIQYSPIMEHVQSHWLWYYNEKDTDWKEKMTKILHELLDQHNAEFLLKNMIYHTPPDYFYGL